MEELYNKIEDYLADTLSAEDKAAFEQALQEDSELAAEVSLHRQLQAALSDPQEIALRQSLQEISTDFEGNPTSTTAKKPFYQSIWFYIGLIATLLIIYLINRNQNTPSILPEVPAQDTILQEESIDSNTLSEVDTTPEEVPEETEPTLPDNTPQEPAVTPVDPFATNPSLETLLDPETWSFRYSFELNANVVELDQGSNVVIDGELVAPDIQNILFTIVIFDNQQSSYPSNPLLSQFVSPRETEDDQTVAFAGKKKYAILLDEIIEDLAPGLYYYQVYMESEPDPLYTGRFRKE